MGHMVFCVYADSDAALRAVIIGMENSGCKSSRYFCFENLYNAGKIIIISVNYDISKGDTICVSVSCMKTLHTIQNI
jgi:Pyruvate/2-oxoacid:ferredoxin oxidoreductase delta subunit